MITALEIDERTGRLPVAKLVERDGLERERAALTGSAGEEPLEARQCCCRIAPFEQRMDMSWLADLEQRIDWMNKHRALVYERQYGIS